MIVGNEHSRNVSGFLKAEEPLTGEKKNRRCLIVLLILLFAAFVTALAVFLYLTAPDSEQLAADPNARTGSLRTTDQTVAPGNYRLVINQTPTMRAGSPVCNVEFEVPSGSAFSSKLTLALVDGGEVLAQTKRVPPGSYIENLELSRSFDPGEYKAKALVEVYERDNLVNTVSAELLLRVIE